MKTYILGHKKPDTDSVIAAMALTYLYQQKECFGHSQPIPAIADPINPETTYLFEKFGVTPPQLITAKDIDPIDQVILVDHNEASQHLEGLDENQIVEIIDHHKVNLNLQSPIFMTFKAWGSTNTIIYYIMTTVDVKPDKTLAALMLAAILSDTVGFKSSTTTPKDREVGEQLAKIAGITDIDSFTLEILKAKSNVGQLSEDKIVTNDYKVFEFAQKTFINQVETVEQDAILKRKDALLKAMANIKTKEKVDLVFCAVTDILQVNTKLLVLSDTEAKIAEAAYGGQVKDHVIDIGPKLSRKKEIAPAIEKALAA